ncbi:MAG: HAD-IIIA family hydrolase [Nitrospirae bacterium]|nr:HAD-IIIA family hydrolase [Nitrospirota bacterium]
MKDLEILKHKVQNIKFLLLDVDGILTDGRIFIDSNGNELKAFHIHDGHGIYLLRKAGIDVGIISGRYSKSVEYRAKELKIEEVHLGIHDKVGVYNEIKSRFNLTDEEFAFMGDDLIDIPLLKIIGLSATASDAIDGVKEITDMVTERRGGEGAVREVIDFILKMKERN